MKIIASVSGGLSSAEMLRRLIAKHGKENVIAVFADVKGRGRSHHWSKIPWIDDLLHERYGGESRDTYRFLWELSHLLDIPIIRLEQEKTIFAHMADGRAFIMRNPGGINYAPCSLVGKRERIAAFLEQNIKPGTYSIALGFDIQELARQRSAKYWWSKRLGFDVDVVCPMMDKPYVDNAVLITWAESEGLSVPAAYRTEYTHNNCNKMCVEAGIGQAALTLKLHPDIYEYWMHMEESLQKRIGTTATILRQQGEGVDPKLSLRDLKTMIENGTAPARWLTDANSKGCSCFSMPMGFLTSVPLVLNERKRGVITRAVAVSP